MFNDIQVNTDFKFKRIKGIQQERAKIGFIIQAQKEILLDKNNIIHKISVPIKQYSNKFLRDQKNKLQQNLFQKNLENYKRMSTIVKKHKIFQKKYNKILSKKAIVCRTQPSQTQYQCFMMFGNIPYEKTKTEKLKLEKAQQSHNFSDFDDSAEIIQTELLRNEIKKSKNQEQMQEDKIQKISTSRGLEFYSKVFMKDKGQVEKMKILNSKKMIKDKILESNRNLQTKQATLYEKNKKSFSIRDVEKNIRRTGVKFRNKMSSESKKYVEDAQNFELKGWETLY